MATRLKKDFQKILHSFLENPAPILERFVAQNKDNTTQHLHEWLAQLALLHGVPFRYLVPDERMLPPESIRFFHLDMNWITALLDGAYSIGRFPKQAGETSASLHDTVESGFAPIIQQKRDVAVRQHRATVLGKTPTEVSDEPLKTVTGFILRSKVLIGWKGVKMVAYAKGKTPDDSNNMQATSPLLLRPLSDQVIIGFYEIPIYRLDIHKPSEGLHFGFDDPDGNGKFEKALKNPADGVPLAGQTLSNQELISKKVFRTYRPVTPNSSSLSKGGQVVNHYNLSHAMFGSLSTKLDYTQPAAATTKGNVSGLQDSDHALLSSDYALQMVEGAGLVSFINDTNPS